MAVGQPFMYDAVPIPTAGRPYNSFDPRAVSRASVAVKVERPKSHGPLISFNQHPDSYLILPYGNTTAKAMSPSSKKRIIQTRVTQLVLRVFELLGAIGSLSLMILISGIDASTAWIMRIPPGIAILHTIYAIYHLSRKAAGRTPASSASYMIFASCFDITLIPFYVFSALVIVPQYKLASAGPGQAGQWTTLLPITPAPMRLLTGIAFLCTTISGGFHVISLILSIYLAVMFRKIVNLPPDMNPLEDNLTSRHKRNKSELTVSTTAEKRLSTPLESRFSSGAPYEDLSRPPSIPFLHTRTGSTDSFTSNNSRCSTIDLPNRQYQLSNSRSASPVNVRRDTQNRSSSPLKQASYSEIPLSEDDKPTTPIKEAWFRTEALSASSPIEEKTIPKKGYQPIHQRNDSDTGDISLLFPSNHPNPLCANPPSPRISNFRSPLVSAPQTQRASSPQAQPARQPLPNPFTRNNSPSASRTALALSSLSPSNINVRKSSSNYSGDLGDASSVSDLSFTENDDGAAADLEARRVQSSAFPTFTKPTSVNQSQPQINNGPYPWRVQDTRSEGHLSAARGDAFKTKQYGDLRAATPPMLLDVHQPNHATGNPGQPATMRQASSGNDYRGSWGMRNVSGKVAEEGRGDESWGTRFRNVSGVVGTTDRLGGW